MRKWQPHIYFMKEEILKIWLNYLSCLMLKNMEPNIIRQIKYSSYTQNNINFDFSVTWIVYMTKSYSNPFQYFTEVVKQMRNAFVSYLRDLDSSRS